MSICPLPRHCPGPVGIVPLPRICGPGLLWFDRLSHSHNIRGVLTIGWRLEDQLGVDTWSTRFNNFKFGPDTHVSAACAVATRALRAFKWPPSVGVVVALGHADRRLVEHSRLSRLGIHVARSLNFHWMGNVLCKRPHRALRQCDSASQREREIAGAYTCLERPDCEILLVIDDFTTNGDTISEIARAVHTVNSSVEVLGFALGKNEKRGFASAHGHHISNNHIPSDWATLWDQHAGRAR